MAGTRIDRRLEPVGWSRPDFVPQNTSLWSPPHLALTAGLGVLQVCECLCVCVCLCVYVCVNVYVRVCIE